MCGLCGFTGDVADRDKVLENMTDVITHRGPDSFGYYKDTDNNISMGFRRLSIIDLDNGSQPIYNEDERRAAVMQTDPFLFCMTGRPQTGKRGIL